MKDSGIKQLINQSTNQSINSMIRMFMRAHDPEPLQGLDTIDAFAVAPWEQSLRQIVDIPLDRDIAIR